MHMLLDGDKLITGQIEHLSHYLKQVVNRGYICEFHPASSIGTDVEEGHLPFLHIRLGALERQSGGRLRVLEELEERGEAVHLFFGYSWDTFPPVQPEVTIRIKGMGKLPPDLQGENGP